MNKLKELVLQRDDNLMFFIKCARLDIILRLINLPSSIALL